MTVTGWGQRKPLRRTGIRRELKERPDRGDKSWREIGKGRNWPASWMAEAKFQAHVESIAVQSGWRIWHCQNPKTSLPGLPDLILIKAGSGILYRELKVRDKNGRANTARGDQLEFLCDICLAGGDGRVWLWPDDDEQIWLTLTGSVPV